jgi:hypothetical protein
MFVERVFLPSNLCSPKVRAHGCFLFGSQPHHSQRAAADFVATASHHFPGSGFHVESHVEPNHHRPDHSENSFTNQSLSRHSENSNHNAVHAKDDRPKRRKHHSTDDNSNPRSWSIANGSEKSFRSAGHSSADL